MTKKKNNYESSLKKQANNIDQYDNYGSFSANCIYKVLWGGEKIVLLFVFL